MRRSVCSASALVLLGCGLLALLVRCLAFQEVFLPDGSVVLSVADGAYHARRAFYTFARFPAALFFDPHLSYPDGAVVPMPPLYDWLLGASARLFAETLPDFEQAIAWASPLLAALTVVPIYVAGHTLYGSALGRGAALLFALLPISLNFSLLGDPDHHAAVALLGASWLALGMALAGETGGPRPVAWVALALVRAALALTWSGSLLYVGLGEGTLLLVALLGGRRDLLVGQAWSALAAAALLAPWVVATGTPHGGPFAVATLSWLHVCALAGVAGLAGSLAGLEARRPSARVAPRLARAALLGAALLAVLLLLPGSRALLPATSFLSKSATWLAMEQAPLFGNPRGLPRSAVQLYGWFAYLIPLVPLAALLRARLRQARGPALVLACWSLVLGGLAIQQRRFGSDFAPAASLGFALLLALGRDAVVARWPQRRASAGLATLAAGTALLWPALAQVHGAQLQREWLLRRAAPLARDSGPLSLLRFARLVREATPEPGGFLDPAVRPAYGILAPPNLGHVLHWTAQRATPADNFGSYLDPERLDVVLAFYAAASEAEALAYADRLQTRYVVTSDSAALSPKRFLFQLQRRDGSAQADMPHSEHFRLVTEGPAGGRPLRVLYPDWQPGSGVPYKLFERVPGAVLEARVSPGTRVSSELELVTPAGRSVRWRAWTAAGADGIARLRVPYASQTTTPVHARGPHRVRVGDHELLVTVSDADVLSGAVLSLAPPPGG